MNISDYFEVVSTKNQVFHFRLKGFWSDEVMAQIETEFIALFFKSVNSMRGQRFFTLADTTAFKAPTHRAKGGMTQAMKYAKEHNLVKTVEVMPSAVTRLAVRQAAKETGEDDFRVVVSSVEEGWEKIKEMKKSL